MRSIPTIVISALHSGAGKTTATVAIAKSLRERGLKVIVFKCGPDYLDPTYHSLATGQESHNLDGWMMGREAVLDSFQKLTQGFDFALIEGVMGLFDGAEPQSLVGSTAEIANWLQAPVIPVIDISAMAGTIRIIEQGLKAFDHTVRIGGIIANFAGSRRHIGLIQEALEEIPLLGGFVREKDLSFPERHLGLSTARYQEGLSEKVTAWSKQAEESIAIDQVIELGKLASPSRRTSTKSPQARHTTCRIAIARDEAFHFYYPENLRLLQEAGAKLIEFSPLQDSTVPECEGIILGGGYPELHLDRLANNRSMIESIKDHYRQRKPIYAECGGLIYLCHEVEFEDRREQLVGLIDGHITIFRKLKALGYNVVSTSRDTFLGPKGTRFRGHQFRYSDITIKELDRSYELTSRRTGKTVLEGYGSDLLVASYVHAHWSSNPAIPKNFVQFCTQQQR